MSTRREVKEPLIFAIRRALLVDYNKQKVTITQLKMLDDYFPEGYMFLTEVEYRHLLSTDPCKLNQGVVTINPKATSLMSQVRIHTRVGVHCT